MKDRQMMRIILMVTMTNFSIKFSHSLYLVFIINYVLYRIYHIIYYLKFGYINNLRFRVFI